MFDKLKALSRLFLALTIFSSMISLVLLIWLPHMNVFEYSIFRENWIIQFCFLSYLVLHPLTLALLTLTTHRLHKDLFDYDLALTLKQQSKQPLTPKNTRVK